jgi:hypothetical protein
MLLDKHRRLYWEKDEGIGNGYFPAYNADVVLILKWEVKLIVFIVLPPSASPVEHKSDVVQLLVVLVLRQKENGRLAGLTWVSEVLKSLADKAQEPVRMNVDV